MIRAVVVRRFGDGFSRERSAATPQRVVAALLDPLGIDESDCAVIIA